MDGMPVPETSIAEVVTEASAKMHDPKYISSEVDRFVGGQPAIAKLVMGRKGTLGVEGVVTVLFHAALLAQGVARASGRTAPRVSSGALQRVAKDAGTVEALAATEPNLASYIASNVEGDGLEQRLTRSLLAQIAAALVE